jgi:GT2 family glycosyltransferase
MAEIAVIVVNYGAAELAVESVESVLRAAAGGRSVEIHLVDNASPGGDAERLRRTAAARGWGDRVALYLEAENHGFGRGNNLVLRRLAGRADPPDKVFLLNPDARLANDALGVLAAFLDARPDAAVAGCRIAKPDGEVVTAAFRFPSLVGEFTGALNFGPVARLLGRWRTPLSPRLQTQPVDWVAGAALMARLPALAEVGYFDPAYFLYYEEVDLMRRLARAGWRVWHVAEAEVVHVEGAATGVRSGGRPARRPAYWYESWRRYFAASHGCRYALACAVAALAGAALNHALTAARGGSPAAPPRYARDMWTYVIRPLLASPGAAPHG